MTVNQIPVYTVIDTVFAIVSWKVDHIKQVSLGMHEFHLWIVKVSSVYFLIMNA